MLHPTHIVHTTHYTLYTTHFIVHTIHYTLYIVEPSRYQEAYMGSSPALDKSKSWFIYPSTRLVSQGRTGLDGL